MGPDQMKMPGMGKRWMEVVDEWESGGRQGDAPPGMGEPEPEPDLSKRDYYSSWPNAYLLRPEVHMIPLVILLADILLFLWD